MSLLMGLLDTNLVCGQVAPTAQICSLLPTAPTHHSYT